MARAIRPFASAPAEELEEHGYVRSAPGGTEYYAPDAEVLLSDVFLSAHCFRIRDGEDPALVGLSFEPVQTTRRSTAGVTGVLWLERSTAMLRHMEFSYVGLPQAVGEVAGGRVDFEMLPEGGWVVRSWQIRMPRLHERLATVRNRGRTPTIRREAVTGILVAGGAVIDVLDVDGRGLGAGRIEGVVLDRRTGEPLGGASVYVAETGASVEAGEDGSFVIPGLLPGAYQIGFLHPELRILGLFPDPVPVTVTDGPVATAELAIPASAGDGAYARICPDAPTDGDVGAAAGFVHDAAGAPVAGIEVAARIFSYAIDGDFLVASHQENSTTTEDDGFFSICEIPAGRRAMIRVGEDRSLLTLSIQAGRVASAVVKLPAR
jgi:hypothetical protein